MQLLKERCEGALNVLPAPETLYINDYTALNLNLGHGT